MVGLYDEIGGFSGGLSLVRQGDKYGYIDSRANVVIPIVYDYAELYFTDGFVGAKSQGKYGLINERAEVLMTPKYDYVGVDMDKTYADDNADDKVYFKGELGADAQSFAIARKVGE